MSIRTQMRKGLLDACILSIIQSQPEGTIYPILLRLLNKEFIYSEVKPSEQGPKRKYYFITEKGKEELEIVTGEWNKIKGPIDELLTRSVDYDANNKTTD